MTESLYAQLLGLGIFWISVHCAGMCGPIMAGLNANQPPGTFRAAKRVLAYQSGRAVMYAMLGACAGLVGEALEASVQGATEVAGLVGAVVLILVGVARLPPVQRFLGRHTTASRTVSRFVAKVLRRLNRVWPSTGTGRMVAVGFTMGVLPCGMMFWVLGLAASSASPLHGALLMVTLVLMTTPTLVIAGCAPLIAQGPWRKWGQKLLPFGVIVSGVWLGLITSAANGWIGHCALNFSLWGRRYYMMFW